MVGKDFDSGEERPSQGFDASGLLHYIYETLDYSVPRSLEAQYRMDKPRISRISDLQVGDAVFFGSGSKPSSSGIYIGNNQVVLASKSADEVVRKSLTGYYKENFLGARRILKSEDRLKIRLVLDARKYLGTPYKFGADYGQTRTFDCSSFMKTIYSENGIRLPRKSIDQAKQGKYVSKSKLEVGDLVFFTTPSSGNKIGHVGIYVGNGQMIHTFGAGGVKYSSIHSDWWKERYVTARRVI
nr:C40 family peptidase [Paenibacillus turpanensis]